VFFVANKKKKFNDQPFAYHAELELEIQTLTNLGVGLGRVPLPGDPESRWVVMVPFALPGERVKARVFRNHKNFSEADLAEVLVASPDRVAPLCKLFAIPVKSRRGRKSLSTARQAASGISRCRWQKSSEPKSLRSAAGEKRTWLKAWARTG